MDGSENREDELVSEFLRELAAAPLPGPLPDAGHLYWKSRLLARWEAERRAVAPVEAVERFEPLAAVIALLVTVVLGWPFIDRALSATRRVLDGQNAAAEVGLFALATVAFAIVSVLIVFASRRETA
jgi:hypothetical protein